VVFFELPFFGTNGWPEIPGHILRGFFIFFFTMLRKIDVVHSFNVASPMVGLSTALIGLVKKIKRVKLVVDWDDWWGKGGLTSINRQGKLQEQMAEVLETGIPLLADKITLHSELIRKRALSVGVQKQKIHKIYNGCRFEEYSTLHKEAASVNGVQNGNVFRLGKPVLFFGGSIVNIVPFLLNVCMLMKKKGAKFILIIAGPADQKHKRFCEELSLNNNVVFLGRVSYIRYKKCVVDSDVLLLPRSENSLIDRCTFPGRIGDYLCGGKPIVANDVGEIRYIFQKYNIGILVSPDDVEGFCNAILELLRNSERRKIMGDNATKLAKGDLSWRYLTKNLIKNCYA
jgi:glycosyltransferase involved in cell wall biosynthesis